MPGTSPGITKCAVSRTRCSVLHDAPQSRDPPQCNGGMDPGAANAPLRAAQHPGNEIAYSAGLACGGGGAAAGGVPVAAAVAAFFSTRRTARIEPSYSASNGMASEAWLRTSGGVRTAAMMKAITMK